MTPAKMDSPYNVLGFWLNIFFGCMGTFISSCTDTRKNKKFNVGHFIMGIIQCVLCPFALGYCLSVGWGTCLYLKGKDDINEDWEFMQDVKL